MLVLMNRTDLVPQILNQAFSEIREQYLSAEKAKRLLGWCPAFTMDEALRETIDWYTARASEWGWNGSGGMPT